MSLLTLLPNKGQEGSSRLTRNFGLFSTAPETRAASRRGTVTSLFQSLLIEGWGFKHMRRRASRDCWVQEGTRAEVPTLSVSSRFLSDSNESFSGTALENASIQNRFEKSSSNLFVILQLPHILISLAGVHLAFVRTFFRKRNKTIFRWKNLC